MALRSLEPAIFKFLADCVPVGPCFSLANSLAKEKHGPTGNPSEALVGHSAHCLGVGLAMRHGIARWRLVKCCPGFCVSSLLDSVL